jgi:phosphoribosylformimino-5-aminoimidazole carboxamide ribotide isomerase
LSWYAFDTIYIADLNAIECRGGSNETLLALTHRFPGVRFWLDAGFRDPSDLEPFLDRPGIQPVLASESQTSLTGYETLCDCLEPREEVVLSLDYAHGQRLGPPMLFEEAVHWPGTIILMNLDRVGANEGPDWPLLIDIKTRAEDRRIAAAGGVRDIRDLRKLGSAGIDSTLIASAIHNGQLTAQDIEAVSGP